MTSVLQQLEPFLSNYNVLSTITLPDISLNYVTQNNISYILIRCVDDNHLIIRNTLHKINSPFIVPVESEYVMSDGTYIHRYISPMYQSKPFYSLANFMYDNKHTDIDSLFTTIIRDLLSILLIFHANRWLFNSFDLHKFYLDDTYGYTHLRFIGFYPTYKFHSKNHNHLFQLIMNDFSDPELTEVHPPLLSFDIYSFGKFIYYLITGEKSLELLHEINEEYEQNPRYNRFISIIKLSVDNENPNRLPLAKIIRDPVIIDHQLYNHNKYCVQIGPNYNKFDHLLKATINHSYYGHLILSKINSLLLYCDLKEISFDIHVDPESVNNNIFVRCTNTIKYIPLTIGMKVIKGPHWRNENKDIDGGYVGIVEYIDEYDTCQVYVRWIHSRLLLKHIYSDQGENINFEVIPAYPPLMIGEKVRSLDGGSVGTVIQLKTKGDKSSSIYSQSLSTKDYMPTIDWGNETKCHCYGQSNEFDIEVEYHEYMNSNIKNSIDEKFTLKISDFKELLMRYQNSQPNTRLNSDLFPKLFTHIDSPKDKILCQSPSRHTDEELNNNIGSDRNYEPSHLAATCSYRQSVDGLYNNYSVGNFISPNDEWDDNYSYGEIKSVDQSSRLLNIEWHQFSSDLSSYIVTERKVNQDDYAQCTPSKQSLPIIKVGQIVGITTEYGGKMISLKDNLHYRVYKITNNKRDSYFSIALEKLGSDSNHDGEVEEIQYHPYD